MNRNAPAGILSGARTATAVGVMALGVIGTVLAWDDDRHMTVHSTTFADGGTLPLIMIPDSPNSSGQNVCTASGAAGSDESPQLSWEHAPRETRSFVVVMYDVTAGFTHWGMFNISGERHSLPLNAGVPSSTYGDQFANDFGDPNYDGPCPPTAFTPLSHEYQITVYALDTRLAVLPGQGDFPFGAEGFYHQLLDAARHHHILESASITGYYSAAATTAAN